MITFAIIFAYLVVALTAAAWRYFDGRGIPAHMNWLRMTVCGVLAYGCTYGAGVWGIPLALVFVGIWAPEQKERESIKDMLWRWALPFFAFGEFMSWLEAGTIAPTLYMTTAGVLVALLVWLGATYNARKVIEDLTDASAVSEPASAAIAFMALAQSAGKHTIHDIAVGVLYVHDAIWGAVL